MDVFGGKSKSLIDIINDLEHLGIERSQIPLPRIVVVGDQSAGKSSVIEALSRIKVPRASGTCTRCPIQITMTGETNPNAPWQCRISVIKSHIYHNLEEITEEQGYWETKDAPEVIPLEIVKEKGKLEHLIKLAQDAILTPGVDPRDFFQDGRPPKMQLPQVKFSPNAVCLEISDYNIPNLSFCDLPGIISQTESTEEEYLITVVQDLARTYMKGNTTLILLACSMGSDIHTSSAASLVRQARASDRCIGILTKPDLLQDAVDVVHGTLSGKKFKLGHGYFVTKQPSSPELAEGIGHDGARARERGFFANNEPWNTKLSHFNDRFGTENLRLALASKLASIIEDSLPDIIHKVDEQLDAREEELAKFPQPTGNAYGDIVDFLNQLNHDIRERLEGVADYGSSRVNFQVEWKGAVTDLLRALINKIPDVAWQDEHDVSISLPFRQSNTPSTPSKGTHEPIVIDDEEEPASMQTTPSPQKKRRLGNGDAITPTSSPKVRKTGRNGRNGTRNPANGLSRTHKWKLEDVKNILERFSASGLPDEYDSRALDELIRMSMRGWELSVSAFVRAVRDIIFRHVEEVQVKSLGPYQGTPLPQAMKELTHEFLIRVIDSISNATNQALMLENFKPATWNRNIHARLNTQERDKLGKRRNLERANLLLDEEEEESGKSTEGPDSKKKIAKEEDRIKKALEKDDHHSAIEAVAKVRAYYYIAAPRFVDEVGLILQAGLLGECRDNLKSHWKTGLGMVHPDLVIVQGECVKLLSQDSEREKQRIRLTREKDALEKAQDRLKNLPDIEMDGCHGLN
ncbi:MAG: hypothetical protein M1822_008521 [Bathelium mastoideum]|nr:MAG: hypothetical protein M1822_008521 [Bathelium mastoideum]